MNFKADEDVHIKCKTCNINDTRTMFVIKIEGHGLDECFLCEIFSIRKILQLSNKPSPYLSPRLSAPIIGVPSGCILPL